MTTDDDTRQMVQLALMGKYLEAHGWVQTEEWMTYRRQWRWEMPLFATKAVLKQFGQDLPAVLEAVVRDEGRCKWTRGMIDERRTLDTGCGRGFWEEYRDFVFCPYCGRRIVIVESDQ